MSDFTSVVKQKVISALTDYSMLRLTEKVVVNTSGASSIAAKLKVTVNGVQYGDEISLTTSATDYTFNAPDSGMQAGEIVFTYTQTSSKAIYIKSIAIN